MKNSADRGGSYPPRPKVKVDNTIRDLQNSSYPTKAKFNNRFIIHSKIIPSLKTSLSGSLGDKGLFRSTNILRIADVVRRRVFLLLLP